MIVPVRFSFTNKSPGMGDAGYAPLLPIVLTLGTSSITAQALLDTGASVNILPYTIGQQLGLSWERQNIPLQLGGNVTGVPARAVLLEARIAHFAPVQLAFGWVQTDNVPILLGQVNFFAEFDVCFFRSQLAFDVKPKSP